MFGQGTSGVQQGPMSGETRGGAMPMQEGCSEKIAHIGLDSLRPVNPRDLLVRRAAQLRNEADALEQLARSLPGEMHHYAEEGLRRLVLTANRLTDV